MAVEEKFRLVTRSDFDGLVCAVLFKELDVINDIKFVHPKDVQDGTVLLSENDITANLPFDRRVQRAFDHHASESIRLKELPSNYINRPTAPSAARVVYDYYGGASAFPNVSDDLMAAVDKGDSAQFSMEDIINPAGWPLLNFLMDARTGLGRFRTFSISNYQLMMELIDFCRTHAIDDVANFVGTVAILVIQRREKRRFTCRVIKHRPPIVVAGGNALTQRDCNRADIGEPRDNLPGDVLVSVDVQFARIDVGFPGADAQCQFRVFLVGDDHVKIRH